MRVWIKEVRVWIKEVRVYVTFGQRQHTGHGNRARNAATAGQSKSA